jgi:GTPase SAR1 family protein
MGRFFNFRGIYHKIEHLIDSQQYFLIHAPRQTGKTTFVHQLAHHLNQEGKYIAVTFSVESAGVPDFTENMGNERMVNALFRTAPLFLPADKCPPAPIHPTSIVDYLGSP